MKPIFPGTFILAILLLSCHYSLSQSYATIIGRVVDSATNESLPGVTVYIDEHTGTTTNEAGRYSMGVSTGEHEIEFHFIGYKTTYKKITIDSNQAQIINVKLVSENTELGTIVISAGKFEQNIEEVVISMEVIHPQLIENKNATTLETTIDQVPGVTVIDGQANIRGGSGYSYGAGSRVLLLMDGIPLLAPDANDVKWNFLPIENVEQVEVIKGATSSLYGSAAMNGIINLRTATPLDTPATQINFFYGWYGK